MKNILLYLTAFFFLSKVYSQDTIAISLKPQQPVSFFNQGRLVNGVTSPNNSRLDLYDKQTKAKVAIPTNFIGNQSAPTGQENYLGILTYDAPSSLITLKDKMEYGASTTQFTEPGFIQVKLPSDLGNKEYWVIYKVSLADQSKFATSGWGVHFSDKELSNITKLKSTLKPQLTYTNSVIKDKIGWTELKTKFKSTGNEKYMTIGCFDPNFKFEEVLGGINFGLTRAYYYVSDIKLIEIPSDIDKDGIIDRKDRCIDIPGLAKYQGCPDTDGDSIPDPDDLCPTQKGLIAFKGCPDTDGDGIEDSKDKCPTVFGTVADLGCPHVEAIVIDEKNIQSYVASLKFENGKETLTGGSVSTLDMIAGVMKEDPFISITFDDFVDEGADAKKSKELSKKRAVTIISYLSNKGCDPKNVKYTGGNSDANKIDTKNGGRRTEAEASGNKR